MTSGMLADSHEFDLSLGRERLTQVRHGAVLVTTEPAVFRVHGPGALTCLQGLLTNDLVKPGDNSLVYGALLTPKGAVVVDYWVLREPGGITLVAPRSGHEASLDLFRRQLPPRLAKVTDLTGHARVAWLIGAHGFQTLASSGVTIPEATGRVADLLLQLNRDEGVTMIVVTHNAALARRIGRTLELARGMLKEAAR